MEEPSRIVEDAHQGGGALAISADSRLGASGGLGGRLRIWRLPDGEAQGRWLGHQGAVTGLTFLANGRRLLSTGWDGHIRLWRIPGQPLGDWDLGAPITSFQASTDHSLVLVGLRDGRVALWSVQGEQLQSWHPSQARISAVAIDANAAQLAAADSRGRVWRWSRRSQPSPLLPPTFSLRTLAFNPRDDTLWGGGWFDLYLWPNNASRPQRLATPHHGIINHIEFGPRATYLATISRQTDSAVLLLDPVSGKSLRTFRKHALCGIAVAVSPDGRSMMSSSDDATVRVYDLTRRP